MSLSLLVQKEPFKK